MASAVRMVSEPARGRSNHHHLGCLAGLFQAQGLLDGDFIEWIHRHLDVGQFTPDPSLLTRTLTL